MHFLFSVLSHESIWLFSPPTTPILITRNHNGFNMVLKQFKWHPSISLNSWINISWLVLSIKTKWSWFILNYEIYFCGSFLMMFSCVTKFEGYSWPYMPLSQFSGVRKWINSFWEEKLLIFILHDLSFLYLASFLKRIGSILFVCRRKDYKIL